MRRYYQLTHDYLVPSLRDWLTRKQRETRRGRAELCLAERAATWSARRENRFLPSLLEFVRIRLLTNRRHWSGDQTKMMRKAGRVQMTRSALALVLLAIVTASGLSIRANIEERRQQDHAGELVQRLAAADIGQVPAIINEMGAYRRYADPLLRDEFAAQPDESAAKLHAALALAPIDDGAARFVRDQLVNVNRSQFPVVRDLLAANPKQRLGELSQPLWAFAIDAAKPITHRFQAACALATYAPDDDRWHDLAPPVAQHLLGLPAADLVAWRGALRPARGHLKPPLAAIFRDSAPGTQPRQFAAETLADYAADDATLLAELLLEADPRTFEPLLAALAKQAAAGIARLEQELDKTHKPQWNDPPLNESWSVPQPVLAQKIRQADGLIDERWALCLSLPFGELLDVCEGLRGTGYRPVSVVTWPRGTDVLAGVVWSRDGRDWKLAGPVSADDALRLDEQQRQAGLTPRLVDFVPPTGRDFCILWGPRAEDPAASTAQPAPGARLQLAAAPAPLPVTWSAKMFRFDPGTTRQPPADWPAATAGQPFLDQKFPNLEIKHPAELARTNGWQNLVASFQGSFQLESGDYRLWAVADDGVRIYFDDKLVIDRWSENDRKPVTVTVAAEAGTHEVRVEHYQLDGAWTLAVRLGHPQIELLPATTSPGSETAVATAFDKSTLNGTDLAAVTADLKAQTADGYRPFAVNFVTGQPGEPTRAELFCRRPAIAEDAKDLLAQSQSHAALALARLGQPQHVWPRLAFAPDPRLRTEIVHDLADFQVDAQILLDRLEAEPDVPTRRAVLLAIGMYSAEQLPAARRTALVEKLLADYATEPDPGLHGAIEWLLRKWGHATELQHVVDRLKASEAALRALPAEQRREWYVNSQGQTFVLFPAGEFLMGSPEHEPQRFDNEHLHRRRIERPFALAATEVTRAQYLAFVQSTAARDPANQYVKTGDSPQTGMEWFEAARYCNWLSEQEGIVAEQWCYEPNNDKVYGPGMKVKDGFLDLAGYRLPTEAEWEYACRAGTRTRRYFGFSERRLPEYAWLLSNSQERAWPVGLKAPNDAGMFDMLGNALEWCQNGFFFYPQGQAIVPTYVDESAIIDANTSRVLRGASFLYQSSLVRSADRYGLRPGYHGLSFGFRPARTYR